MTVATEQKTATCAGCGVVEHFDLLDEECVDGAATGRLLCVRCDPHWEPAWDDSDIRKKSVAPQLAGHYLAYLLRKRENEKRGKSGAGATVIAFPVLAKATAIGGLEEITLSGLRLPRRVFNRLVRHAAVWDVSPAAAAEMLLTGAINDAAGVGRRK